MTATTRSDFLTRAACARNDLEVDRLEATRHWRAMARKLSNQVALTETEEAALPEIARLIGIEGGNPRQTLIDDSKALRNFELTEKTIADFGPRQNAIDKIAELQSRVDQLRLEVRTLEGQRNDLHHGLMNVSSMSAGLVRMRSENPRLFA